MHVPFSSLPTEQRAHRLFDLIALFVFGAVVMALLPPAAQPAALYGGPRPTGDAFDGWVSVFGPIAPSIGCFQSWSSSSMTGNPACIAMLKAVSPVREAAVVLADCLFAIGYGLGGALAAWWLGERASRAPLRELACRLASWSLLAAGVLDIVENLAILAMIAGAHWEVLVVIARAAAVPKYFGCVAALFAMLGVALLWRVAPRR